MGRSTTSCFKIISCGGSDESVDKDDIDASSQNKGPDKRGWSFRKRSARHRVLSNTVVTEIPSSENKESSVTEIPSSENKEISVTEIPSSENKGSSVTEIPSSETKESSVTEIPSSENKETSEPVTVSSEALVNSTISENQWTEEMPRLSNSITKDSTVSTMTKEAACEDDIKREFVPDESATTEAAYEDDIKCESGPDESAILVIQAAVRRFLAQRQLIKHKNVVKLQAAVRGHLVRNHAVGTLRCVHAIVKMQTLVRARYASLSAERSAVGEKGLQNPGISSHPSYISIEKLLNNKLARQLLESTPRSKQINIKCDPLNSDSAWNWLERWMSVSSLETVKSHAPEQDQDKVKNTENQVETVTLHCESTDMTSNVGEASVPSAGQENLIDIEQDSNARNHEEEKPQPANTCTPDSMEKPDSSPDETMHLNAGAQIEVSSISEKPVSETEPKPPAQRFATDQADSEGRKSVFGSRKASNPAFIAAQSRFEELTSKSNPLKSVDSFNQDNEAGLSADIDSAAPENATVMTDVEREEHLVVHSSRVVLNSGSECGTELSITSTLDSPDQSEAGNKKSEEEAKVLDETVGDMNGNDNIDVEEHAFPSSNKTSDDLLMPEKHDSGDDSETEKLKPGNNIEQKLLDNSPSDADIELEPESGHQVYKSNAPMELEQETVHQAYKSSGEASPRSHITVPESQGTPSSQLSTNTKKTRSDKKVSSQKRKSWSTSKKSSVTSSPDSGLRNSLEQLPKDSKPGKRRNSFGSPRPDHIYQEASGNSSVPSYMQATESARAKAIANSSPRSSPDVQDKEIYLKKRHSLPGAVNERKWQR
ncbi:hypothetical protein Ccrd_007563 [Cynara cardunculus var. scolymus]|uniref:DUF4005 domain-containing protein n=1 Tax=Cynara cardunculus var. scolymus TaxID=59895 RepID=A0A103XGP7_CYNCS|nr:hypothetical protein Ccrd_007563 [Cynara cardunculus var. scolymus]